MAFTTVYVVLYRYDLPLPSEPKPSNSRLGPRATCEGANGAIGGQALPQKSRCQPTTPEHGCRVAIRVVESHKPILGSNFLCQKNDAKNCEIDAYGCEMLRTVEWH